VLTDSNVRCAPVLETTASRLTPAHFQTVSERADKLEPPMSNQLERAA